MSDWYTTDLRFTDRQPTREELIRLNRALNTIDYNAPKLEAYGISRRNWESPYDFKRAMSFLLRAGFPCEGWQHEECEYGSGYGSEKYEPAEEMILSQNDVLLWDNAYNSPIYSEEEDLKDRLRKEKATLEMLRNQTYPLDHLVKTLPEEESKEMVVALDCVKSFQKSYENKIRKTQEALIRLRAELYPNDAFAKHHLARLGESDLLWTYVEKL